METVSVAQDTEPKFRLRKRKEGVTVAEFALVAPLVFLLMFGFMEGARIFSTWIILNNEAREGARIAAVANGVVADSGALACEHVLGRASGVLNTARLSCSTQSVADTGGNVVDMTLTLRYSMDLLIPIAKQVFGSTFSLAARSSMRPE